MGLFDVIGGAISHANDAVNSAQLEAEDWSPCQICDRIKSTSSISRRMGYGNTLRVLCRQMDDRELKSTFNYAYERKNVSACMAMMSVMEDRELAYKDDNGRIHKNYSY